MRRFDKLVLQFQAYQSLTVPSCLEKNGVHHENNVKQSYVYILAGLRSSHPSMLLSVLTYARCCTRKLPRLLRDIHVDALRLPNDRICQATNDVLPVYLWLAYLEMDQATAMLCLSWSCRV